MRRRVGMLIGHAILGHICRLGTTSHGFLNAHHTRVQEAREREPAGHDR